ncbi:hypothetical protein I302_102526 [Kwoniella bestiolae CBS 10118]
MLDQAVIADDNADVQSLLGQPINNIVYALAIPASVDRIDNIPELDSVNNGRVSGGFRLRVESKIDERADARRRNGLRQIVQAPAPPHPFQPVPTWILWVRATKANGNYQKILASSPVHGRNPSSAHRS